MDEFYKYMQHVLSGKGINIDKCEVNKRMINVLGGEELIIPQENDIYFLKNFFSNSIDVDVNITSVNNGIELKNLTSAQSYYQQAFWGQINIKNNTLPATGRILNVISLEFYVISPIE